ncbi:MAG: Flp pilus assembly protein CpaB, partial [Clostridia bacterium]|nr:Flp pilus assembly protein CpaB [Clostridia bacterium]
SSAVRVRLIRMKADMSEGDKLMETDIEMFEGMRFAGSANSTLEIPWERRTDVIGSPLRAGVRRGDILTWRDFMQVFTKERTGLPAQTRSGWRAVSIPVSSVTSVSGLIRPNDFVDVIGTFHFPDARGDSSLDTVTMTILQRVKVLATGADIGYAQQDGSQSSTAAARSYSTITLELTPKEVEMIIFAQQIGSLTLSLRSYEDPNITTDVQNVDWAYLQQHIKDYTSEREQLLRKTTGY